MRQRLCFAVFILFLLGVADAENDVSATASIELYVSPTGDDSNPGTKAEPFATVSRARDVVRTLPELKQVPISVILRRGVYYLPKTLVFTAADSGGPDAVVEYRSAPGEEVVISGGFQIQDLKWEFFRNGIMQAKVPEDFSTDQLFVNGERKPMARYPNYDPEAKYFDGTAEDAFSNERASRWQDPTGGFMHVLHKARWGGMHYRITGKDSRGSLTSEGGWQNNRGSSKHPSIRFVENIFEELDAPDEWFLDAKANMLYFYPPKGFNVNDGEFEGVRLRHLVELRGTEDSPVRFLALKGLNFRHAARTFMDNKERILRTDWTMYRGGALSVNGTEDCRIEDCNVAQVGGNAIFVNNYNRRLSIYGCHVFETGGNGIVFVGDPKAVRNGLVGYGSRARLTEISKEPGPKSNNYPADSIVEECLIHDTGQIEKQTAGVEIDMAMNITVRHCSIYVMPRAGVNIGDGCWGGHVIEFCDVFDTVLETGDHGAFNSWGRDRFWGLKDVDLNTITLGKNANLPLLDVIYPNILRNNRWRCDHGWDIDLDDGSSNCEIRNNLCLNGGIKNREGFYRIVENNIMVNDTFHPHVWYGNSEDVFRNNIVFEPYKPRVMKQGIWGKELDHNLLHSTTETGHAAVLAEMSGRDEHSLVGNARFVDPATGDYRVEAESVALELGFENFAMDSFGVQIPRLRELARTPVLPIPGQTEKKSSSRDQRIMSWFGAKIRNIVGLGDVSAAGLSGETGVRLIEVPEASAAAQSGFQINDVILKCGGHRVDTTVDLLRHWATTTGQVSVEIWRNQESILVEIHNEQAQQLKGIQVATESRNEPSFQRVRSPSNSDLAQESVPKANSETKNESLATLTDGRIAHNYGPVFPNGVSNGVYLLDLGSLKCIAEINSFSTAIGDRGHQVFSLFGSRSTSDPGYDVWDAEKFAFIASVDTRSEPSSRFSATSVRGHIGEFRWLVWAVEPVNGKENTAYQEFDVIEWK